MNRLTYPTTDLKGNPLTLERFENDTRIIDILVNKGWVNNGPYLPPPPDPKFLEEERQEQIRSRADDLVRSACGSDPSYMMHLLMRGIKRAVKKADGRANTADLVELEQLEKLADYIEDVRNEQKRLIANKNLTVNDANWPTTP